MSVLSSTSGFMPRLNTQGLFSSRTAFQRPKLHSNSINSQLVGLKQSIRCSEENETKRPFKQVQTALEDPEIVFSVPVKKVKSVPKHLDNINLLKSNNMEKPSKLTVEMIFNTPLKTTKTKNNSLFDNDENEDSDLSFISPSSSINELEVIDEEEAIEVDKNQSYKKGNTDKSEADSSELVIEPLVVKDGFASQLNYLNADGYTISNAINYPVTGLYGPYTNLNQLLTLNNSFNRISNQSMQPNLNNFYPVQTFMDYSSIQTTDFIQNQARFMLQENETVNQLNTHFENLRAKVVDLEADGYDSDSHATRSTGVGPNQEGERSQKGSSPLYSITEEVHVEEKVQLMSLEQAKKKKRGRKSRKSAQEEGDDVDRSMKSKKGRALNLDIDINPKHLKVERRLNKLQLLRYQQEAPEAQYEEYMKKLAENLVVSRNNSLFNDTNDNQSTVSSEEKAIIIEAKPASYENTLATIPPLSSESSRRRSNLVVAWTPEDLSSQELDNYMQQLSEILEFQVTDQEKCLKLLKTFSMNIGASLDVVRGNKAEYSELLKIKVRRLRRH